MQQILCTIPTKDTVILHSRHFSKHDKVKSLVKRYPNATVNKPTFVAWAADYNEFGLWSAYTFQNARMALACNGMYLYKENGEWRMGDLLHPGVCLSLSPRTHHYRPLQVSRESHPLPAGHRLALQAELQVGAGCGVVYLCSSRIAYLFV